MPCLYILWGFIPSSKHGFSWDTSLLWMHFCNNITSCIVLPHFSPADPQGPFRCTQEGHFPDIIFLTNTCIITSKMLHTPIPVYNTKLTGTNLRTELTFWTLFIIYLYTVSCKVRNLFSIPVSKKLGLDEDNLPHGQAIFLPIFSFLRTNLYTQSLPLTSAAAGGGVRHTGLKDRNVPYLIYHLIIPETYIFQ